MIVSNEVVVVMDCGTSSGSSDNSFEGTAAPIALGEIKQEIQEDDGGYVTGSAGMSPHGPGFNAPREEMIAVLQELNLMCSAKPRLKLLVSSPPGNEEAMTLDRIMQKVFGGEWTDNLDVIEALWSLTTVDQEHGLTVKQIWNIRNDLKRTLLKIFSEERRVRLRVCCCLPRFYAISSIICGFCECVVAPNAVYYEAPDSEAQIVRACRKCAAILRREPSKNPRLRDVTFSGQGKKNLDNRKESTIPCSKCHRKFHTKCCNFVLREGIRENRHFICDFCRKDFSIPMTVEDQYFGSPEGLPTTDLSEYIEERVNKLDRTCTTRKIYVRVVSCVPACFQLEDTLKNFLEPLGVPASYPYTLRTILCFQELEQGKFTAFFALYTQEYGENAPSPNKQSIYINMLDSCQLVESKLRRSYIFYSVMLGYLQFMRFFGFTTVYLWACPPKSKEVEYVFNRRPPKQQLINLPRLIEWYLKFIRFGSGTIFSGYNTLNEWSKQLNDAGASPELFFNTFPYFLEDYWPGFLKETIEAVDSEVHAGDGALTSKTEMVHRYLMTELQRIDQHFFRIDLKSYESKVPQHRINVLMQSPFPTRDALVDFQRYNDLEFSDHRKGCYSTKVIIMELMFEQPTAECEVCFKLIYSGKKCHKCDVTFCENCFPIPHQSSHSSHSVFQSIKATSRFAQLWGCLNPP